MKPILALVAALALTGCGSHAAAPADTTTATTSTTLLPVRAPLTPSEHEACASWTELKADKTASDSDVFRRILFEVAGKTAFDAPNGRVHVAAQALVDAFQDMALHGGSKDAIGDAAAKLTDACS